MRTWEKFFHKSLDLLSRLPRQNWRNEPQSFKITDDFGESDPAFTYTNTYIKTNNMIFSQLVFDIINLLFYKPRLYHIEAILLYKYIPIHLFSHCNPHGDHGR